MQKIALWDLLKETFTSWDEDRAPRLAAALSYYTIFALAPLLIIAVAVAALFLDEAQVRQELLGQIGELVGQNGRQAVEVMIEGARQPTTGLIATVIGIITLLVAASGLFGQLQDALNTIWEVQPKPGRGVWGVLKDRFLSFGMVLGVGFLLLVSLIISAVLSGISRFLGEEVAAQAWLWQLINLAVSFGITALLFALIFKILPDAKVRWKDVWIGAIATALLFSVGRFLIGWYLGQAATQSTYGAAGSLVALLIWVYYSSQILFLGAEFTKVYARAYGGQIQPARNAVRVTRDERTQQGLSTPSIATSQKQTVAHPDADGLSKTTQQVSEFQRIQSASAAGLAVAFVVGLVAGRRLSS